MLLSDFSNKILISDDNEDLFRKAFPNFNYRMGYALSDCLTPKDKNKINGIKMRDIVKEKGRYEAIENLLKCCEEVLTSEDLKKYLDAIYKNFYLFLILEEIKFILKMRSL